jgi:hypothetical protein
VIALLAVLAALGWMGLALLVGLFLGAFIRVGRGGDGE